MATKRRSAAPALLEVGLIHAINLPGSGLQQSNSFRVRDFRGTKAPTLVDDPERREVRFYLPQGPGGKPHVHRVPYENVAHLVHEGGQATSNEAEGSATE